MKRFPLICLTAASLLAAACDRNEVPPPAPANTAAAADEPKTYLLHGVLKKIEATESSATIQHEEIPGYMPAMTMPFTVRNTNELEGLQPGDAVVFRLTVTEDDSWIDKLKKAPAPPAAATNEPPQRPAVRVARSVEELKIGDPLPNYQFTNELGQTIELDDFKGKALAITFIFTRCPLPDFCPRMVKGFSGAHKLLTENADAPANWHLLTISFDPHFDTPAVLKSYAERYEYDPKKWSFITGAMIDIDAITDQFNLPIAVVNGQWDHKLRTAVIDASGRVQQIFIGNTWTPQDLADELIKAAQKAPAE